MAARIGVIIALVLASCTSGQGDASFAGGFGRGDTAVDVVPGARHAVDGESGAAAVAGSLPSMGVDAGSMGARDAELAGSSAAGHLRGEATLAANAPPHVSATAVVEVPHGAHPAVLDAIEGAIVGSNVTGGGGDPRPEWRRVLASSLPVASLLGSLSIVVAYSIAVCSSRLTTPSDVRRRFWMRPVFFMALCDIGSEVGDFLSIFDGDLVCTVQGVMVSFFDFASACWVLMIAVQLELVLVQNHKFPEKFEVYFHLFGWLVPLSAVVLPVLLFGWEVYGLDKEASGCWIGEDSPDWLEIAVFFGPLWCFWLCICVIFVRVRNHVKSDMEDQTQRSSILRRLWIYPLLYLLIWGFATAAFVARRVEPPVPLWLRAAHIVCGDLQGFMNSVFFGGLHFGTLIFVREWLTRKGVCKCCWVLPPERKDSMIRRGSSIAGRRGLDLRRKPRGGRGLQQSLLRGGR